MNDNATYLYETHLHTAPGSRCASVSVRENLEFYKKLGYDGVFITNHFLDAPGFNYPKDVPYEEQIAYFFRDYEDALEIGKEIGIKVFFGAEINYEGADFLIYGLDKDWYLKHPEIMQMKRSEELKFMQAQGALVIHAHPFREDLWIDHLQLFPRVVHGVEIINGGRPSFENIMAELYAKHYDLLPFAGSDNHTGKKHGENKVLAGMCSSTPIMDESDFVTQVKAGRMQVFELPKEFR